MLTAIKGYYDHGQIILQEAVPFDTKTEVIVTFLSNNFEHTQVIKKRKLGGLEGKVNLPADFNEPLEDLKDYM